MPYDPSNDQYYWLGAGYTQLPERDGTGYHPEYPSPSFFTAWFELNQHAEPKTLLDIVIIGKMYTGKYTISGVAGRIRMSTLQNMVLPPSPDALLSTEEQSAKLLGLNQVPEKIVGIYFRILD